MGSVIPVAFAPSSQYLNMVQNVEYSGTEIAAPMAALFGPSLTVCWGTLAQGREPGGCFRGRTGPSSTSGNTFISTTSQISATLSRPNITVVERDGTLIMVDDERMPLPPAPV